MDFFKRRIEVAAFVKDLNKEEQRFKTFDTNWPHSFIAPRILAKTGFYFTGPHDQVKCFFCGVVVYRWEIGDDEVHEHSRLSPNCPLLRRQKTLNVPIEPVFELNHLLPQICYDVCGAYDFITHQSTTQNLSNFS